ncbi:MAG TPA: tRNA (N6-isopentenyl adenosine(37)-C2)-methylthiotransferase MiaB [Opitutales bacterium]|nr:tRNA (N6-isopentenyl adenosine(37)-C2)-methylthiotransferase MiaB [Opitutales bacterium]
MNRVHLKTYGCQMNERDSEAVASLLRGRGYAMVEDEAEADIVLLNTCAVRDLAEQKAIGKAAHLMKRKRRNPRFLVGVLGCMAQNRGVDLLDRLPDLDLLVGTQKFHRVPDMLDNLRATIQGQGPQPATLVDLDIEAGSQNEIRGHFNPAAIESGAEQPDAPQVSAYVSIMQGCNMHCTFCIVPKTRGEERSRPLDDIVREAEELVAHGTREITLLGQIVTSYGRREFPMVGGKTPFVQLLERLHNLPDLQRIRFTSPHPSGFKADLIAAYRDLPKLGEYVHLPMQSGSDRILRAMNRPYTSDSYRRLIAQLRAAQPQMWFSTDIIVGFPGETDEDFAATRELFTECGFEMGYLFKYSTRTGTPAAEMPGQVPVEVAEARHRELMAILEKRSLARHEALVGTTQEVLAQEPAQRPPGRLLGRTRGYRKVFFDASVETLGELVSVRITRATVAALEGELV